MKSTSLVMFSLGTEQAKYLSEALLCTDNTNK